jgi:predicted transglutaminase-like cysteine proteinase
MIAALLAGTIASTILQASPAAVPHNSQRPTSLIHVLNFYGAPALPPIGHTRFCLRYPADCEIQETDFRHRNIRLTPERWLELHDVNREVNRDIVADYTSTEVTANDWIIAPSTGDCKDYAITKRHELLERGWPSRTLLLSEVVVPSGEHHLVLVAHTEDADLVLDNLSDDILSVAISSHRYRWVRIETPQNPKLWATMTGSIKIAKNISKNRSTPEFGSLKQTNSVAMLGSIERKRSYSASSQPKLGGRSVTSLASNSRSAKLEAPVRLTFLPKERHQSSIITNYNYLRFSRQIASLKNATAISRAAAGSRSKLAIFGRGVGSNEYLRNSNIVANVSRTAAMPRIVICQDVAGIPIRGMQRDDGRRLSARLSCYPPPSTHRATAVAFGVPSPLYKNYIRTVRSLVEAKRTRTPQIDQLRSGFALTTN